MSKRLKFFLSTSLRGFFVGFATVAIASLAGCKAVGPDPRPPSAPDIAGFYYGSIADKAVSLDTWLASIGDPTLHELIEVAGRQNFDLRQACARITEARAMAGVVRSGLGPFVGLFSSYAFTEQSEENGEFFSADGSSFNQFTKGADVSWQIDLFGKILRMSQAASARVSLAEYDAEFIRRTLLSDTAISYLNIRLLQEQILLITQSLEMQIVTQQLVKERGEAGVSTQLDVAQTESFVERVRAIEASLKQQLEVEFNRLSVLLGETPSQGLRDRLQNLPAVVSSPLPAVGFPADLIRNRPDVRREEMAFIAALVEIGAAEADLYPQLSLTGTIALSATNISNLFDSSALAFAIGPNFRWDIFQSGRIRFNIEAAKSRCQQAHLNYQQQVITAVREVEDSIVQYDGFRQQEDSIGKAVTADLEAVKLSLQRYKAGRANFQRVLDSQQQLMRDAQQLSFTRFNAIQQAFRLYNALGGQWASPLPQDAAFYADSGQPNQVLKILNAESQTDDDQESDYPQDDEDDETDEDLESDDADSESDDSDKADDESDTKSDQAIDESDTVTFIPRR